MAPIGKLYGHPLQQQTIAILSAVAIAGLEIDVPPCEFGVTNKDPEFVQKFPQAKIPAFEDNDGFNLTEGAAIARYVSSLVPESALLGRDVKETALVDQWVHFAESEILSITSLTIFSNTRSLQFLEDYLATRRSGFIVNDSITLADLFVASAVMRAGQTVCGSAEREKAFPHVFAYYAKVASDERIKALFGQPTFLEKPFTVQAE